MFSLYASSARQFYFSSGSFGLFYSSKYLHPIPLSGSTRTRMNALLLLSKSDSPLLCSILEVPKSRNFKHARLGCLKAQNTHLPWRYHDLPTTRQTAQERSHNGTRKFPPNPSTPEKSNFQMCSFRLAWISKYSHTMALSRSAKSVSNGPLFLPQQASQVLYLHSRSRKVEFSTLLVWVVQGLKILASHGAITICKQRLERSTNAPTIRLASSPPALKVPKH